MKKAVILGGSWAGLMAARVLAAHADEVTILTTERAGHEPGGAPHREQLHALLSTGHSQLERLFPGITADITAAGGQIGSGPAVRFYVDGVLRVPVQNDRNTMIGATRTLIEHLVLERVSALPNVHLLYGRAIGLTVRNERVAAVRADTASTSKTDSLLDLEADLVVDAMGRASRLGQWLKDQGWEPPPLQRIRIDLGYATASFRRGTELPKLVIAHAAPGPTSGYQPTLCEAAALAAVEDNQWNVVVSGYADHRPGRSAHRFFDRMRKSAPPFREIAESCDMIGEVTPFSFAESQRRLFRSVARFPGGLIPIGDTVASVNPIYGQGLTLALLQSEALSNYLTSGPSLKEPARPYLQAITRIVDTAWNLSTTADLAQPHVTGPYPRGYSLTRWIGDRVLLASVIDPNLCAAFMDVLHMQQPPSTLARPALLARTARVLAAERRRTRQDPFAGSRNATP
ncbi:MULTISPECIES: NAD(P)/FAD-dependent oxidoreductase [unclassified Streptomyces]|uniref:NAD(P)/FAD-dependent oxidoreductase n=1 Tax=unclassified Streptomyces TaxID=2593676 RepID=UPI00380F209C